MSCSSKFLATITGVIALVVALVGGMVVYAHAQSSSSSTMHKVNGGGVYSAKLGF